MPDVAVWQWVAIYVVGAFSWGFLTTAGADLYDLMFHGGGDDDAGAHVP